MVISSWLSSLSVEILKSLVKISCREMPSAPFKTTSDYTDSRPVLFTVIVC